MKDTSNKDLFKQIFVVLGGQSVRTGLGFLAIIMTARLLSVEDFGLFSIFLAAVALGTELTGKSLDWGLVHFASQHLETARKKSYLYFKAVFKIRIIISAIIILLAFGLVEFIANDIFEKPEYETPLLLASLGTIAMSLWWFTLAVAQAKEKFTLHAILNCTNGILKVTAVGILFYWNVQTLGTVLFTYVLSFFAMFVLGMVLIPKAFFKAQGSDKEAISEVLHFSKWALVANLIIIVQSQSAIFFLGYFENAAAVGKFSSAWNLIYGIDIMVFALMTVLLPKVSKAKGKKELTAYMKKSFLISILLSVLFIPVLIYGEPFVVLIYSDKFSDVGLIFQILLLGSLISLPAHPISLVLFSMNQPKYYAYVWAVILVLTFMGYIIVIPQFSLIGAAMVSFGMKILQGILIVGVCYFLVNRPEPIAPLAEESL